MSKTVKFIVEMPKELSERVCQASSVSDMQGIDIVNVISLVKHGMPLDDVKALIEYNAEIHEDGERYLMEQWVYDILDGKYEAESEEV